MRDVNRLDGFYDALNDLHKKYVPDWRFSQMMYNFLASYGDAFYLEEDMFLNALEKYLKATITIME